MNQPSGLVGVWTTCLLRLIASFFQAVVGGGHRLVEGVGVVDDIDMTGKRQVDLVLIHCKHVPTGCLCCLVGHNPHRDRA